jgi:hypothetical protein
MPTLQVCAFGVEFDECAGLTPVTTWKPWMVDKQIAGFLTVFKGNFALATVHGAGQC